MEEVRLQNREISDKVFIARMPHSCRIQISHNERLSLATTKQYSLTTSEMRQTRLRLRAGYSAWEERVSKHSIRDGLLKLLSQAWIDRKRTEAFRDFKGGEIKEILKKDKGKFGYRIKGTRGLSQNEDSAGAAKEIPLNLSKPNQLAMKFRQNISQT